MCESPIIGLSSHRQQMLERTKVAWNMLQPCISAGLGCGQGSGNCALSIDSTLIWQLHSLLRFLQLLKVSHEHNASLVEGSRTGHASCKPSVANRMWTSLMQARPHLARCEAPRRLQLLLCQSWPSSAAPATRWQSLRQAFVRSSTSAGCMPEGAHRWPFLQEKGQGRTLVQPIS